MIFIFIILFLSFKNQIKILEKDLTNLIKNYNNDYQKYINKETLLTKEINHLQVNELSSYEYVEIKKIIKFDRDEFNDFTIIKVNYAQPE